MSRRALELSRLEQILGRAGNDACADCGAAGPLWASVTYGTVLCLEDAGRHRALGVQVSFVRSLDLDEWKDDEVASMLASSNAFVNEFFAAHGGEASGTSRYLGVAAAKLRKVLKRRRAGEPNATTSEDLSAEELAEIRAQQERFAAQKLEREKSSTDAADRPWVPDELAPVCMLCGRTFTMVTRKHHCRKCGRVVCKACAPANNSKPIPQLGYLSPVRHCRACFESAAIAWPRHAPGPPG